MRYLAVLGLVCLARVAAADDAKTEAKQHLDRALALHKDKKYAEALDEMKTAYALDPQPDLLYAIAQLHVQLGQCDRALPFYERFLASNPKESGAAKARQAIEVCKTNPPPVAVQPDPPPAVPVAPPKPEVAPQPLRIHGHAPWYRDYIADALLGAGLLGTAIGIISYVGAVSDNDAAGTTSSYPDRISLLESARDQRQLAIIAGGLGVALVAGGVLKLKLRKTETRLVVVPNQGGGTVAWSRAF